jgi:alpha-D-xyloside xylohydrolase
MKCFSIQLAVLVGLLVAGKPVAAAPTFTEADGVVIIEAEGFSNNVARTVGATTFQWQVTNTVAGFSGAGYLEALPNVETNLNTTWVTISPQLDYTVNFTSNVTHNVWVRGYGTSGNDDSVHAGLDGTTNTAANITLNQLNTWNASDTRTVGGVGTLTAATGTHRFSLWMREDGVKIDRVTLTATSNFTGNVFHIPSNVESNSGGLTMRSPLSGILSNTSVFVYTGNQFQGSGNPGNQLQTGSTIFYRNATNSTWSSIPMFFWYQGGANGNNKYYSNSIPVNVFAPGDVVQYYFKIPYSDHITTYVYGNDSARLDSELESDAQANPFTYTVQAPLGPPTGPYVAYSNVVGSVIYEARVYLNAGQIQLLGPDLSGNPLTNAINIQSPSATANGNNLTFGAVLSSMPLSNGIQFVELCGSTSIVAQVTFPYDGVMHYEVVDWGAQVLTATAITVPSDATEHFYGFGEKFNNFDQAGRKVRMLNVDRFGDKGDDSYKCAPWFMSTRGYGFHLDSTDESSFDMRNGFADRYVISSMVGSSFSGYVTNALKFNVVYGPRLTDVLSRYTAYSGRPSLPPPWAFAPWMSSDIWHNGGEVRYVITKMRERGIPGSVFVFDSPWEVAYNDYTWNTTQFGIGTNLESQSWSGFSSVNDMMTFFRTNGWKVVCWMTPFINKSSNNENVPGASLGQAANYAEAASSNYFVHAPAGGPLTNLVVHWWKGIGSPVDFTNPNATRWLQDQLSNLVLTSQSGGFDVIGGFKTDDGESGHPPEDNSDTYIPSNASYADGRTGVEMRNGYALEYHRAIWSVLGTNGVLFARSGFAGSQAFPGYWCGDNQPNFGAANGLPSVIVAGQSAAASGYAIWGSDVGGYGDGPYETDHANLFMRWTQFGALSPIMQMHRQVGSGQQYPWSFGDAALTNYQNYARLHTALFPYIYSYARQASTNGLPIFRPLILFHQNDSSVFGVNHTYFFGNELLVSPIIASNATSRTVLMPQGVWYDYFTNQRYVGGSNVVWINSNQMQMPLFVREGAIVPMISTNVQTLADAAYVSNPNITTMNNALEFMIYPTTNSSFNVYDGTTVQCQSNGTVVTTSLSSTPRPVLMRFFGAEPFGVERNGILLPNITNATQFAAASLGWRFDVASNFLHVKFNHAGGATLIRLGPDSVGDGISDSWRLSHFGVAETTNNQSCATCDSDGDGLTNEQEYRAGTDPSSATSALTIQSLGFQVVGGTNGFAVYWPTEPGIHYQILWKDDMSTTVAWQTNLTDFMGDGASVSWLDDGLVTGSPPNSTPAGKRFYRVRVFP